MSSEQHSRPAPPALSLNNVVDTGAEARRLRSASLYSDPTSSAGFNSGRNAIQDPQSSVVNFANGLTTLTNQIAYGIILDGSSLVNCYRVSLDSGIEITATPLITGSPGCLGTTPISTYMPGTRVVVALNSRDGMSTILGAQASHTELVSQAVHDYISPFTRLRVDDCHKKLIKQEDAGGYANCNTGRPLDATHASEWGAISTTGAAITLDDFMLRASINEVCGMYAFYHDSLLRLAGYNYQFWSGGHEREAFVDQGEYNDYQGYTPYPWENLGCLINTVTPVQQYEPENYMSFMGQPWYCRWENKHEFAQPYHRTIDFYGYLGQGYRKIVQAPPTGIQRWTYDTKTGTEPERPFDSAAQDGQSSGSKGPTKETENAVTKPSSTLAEQNIGLDGRMCFSSAKGITLLKRVLLPSINRAKRPENIEDGDDTQTNYRAAGLEGAGPEHPITGDIETTNADYPNLQRAAAVMDLHGYLSNYAGIHPFYWHAKDYKTWEQTKHTVAKVNQRIPTFSSLRSNMYLSETAPKKIKIDHRYNEQNYYESESFISLLDDGGIVIGDGYGAEIRMTGGCIFLSAPGDVWLKGGRDVQTWAGNDAIVKANKSVDISSTKESVRIKAEQHLMLLGGNEQATTGGVLIESKTRGIDYDFTQAGDNTRFNGILLRAPAANVVTHSKSLYLKTGSDNGAIERGGHVMIDVENGSKDMIVRSRNFYHYLETGGSVFHFFGQDDETQKANYFRKDFSLLSGRLATERDLIVGGGILCENNVLVAKGHIATEQASRMTFPLVAPLKEDDQNKIKDAIQQLRKAIDADIPDAANDIRDNLIQVNWLDDNRAGNEDALVFMGFSFRTDEDYGVSKFELYEDRWQQMARLGNQEPEKWTEKGVKINVAPFITYPFPGKKWLTDETAYREQDLNIAEFADDGFRDKDRKEAPDLDEAYKTPRFKEPAAGKNIDGNYPIIPRQ
jgi:hypothetical protein